MCGISLVDVMSRHADRKPKIIPAASVNIKRRPLRPPVYRTDYEIKLYLQIAFAFTNCGSMDRDMNLSALNIHTIKSRKLHHDI